MCPKFWHRCTQVWSWNPSLVPESTLYTSISQTWLSYNISRTFCKPFSISCPFFFFFFLLSQILFNEDLSSNQVRYFTTIRMIITNKRITATKAMMAFIYNTQKTEKINVSHLNRKYLSFYLPHYTNSSTDNLLLWKVFNFFFHINLTICIFL